MDAGLAGGTGEGAPAVATAGAAVAVSAATVAVDLGVATWAATSEVEWLSDPNASTIAAAKAASVSAAASPTVRARDMRSRQRPEPVRELGSWRCCISD